VVKNVAVCLTYSSSASSSASPNRAFPMRYLMLYLMPVLSQAEGMKSSSFKKTGAGPIREKIITLNTNIFP